MKQQSILTPIPCDKYDLLSKGEITILHKEEERIRISLQKEVKGLKQLLNLSEQKSLLIDEQFITIKNKFFGKSSEKSPKKPKSPKEKEDRKKKIQLPSERYPNTPVVEEEVVLDDLPDCIRCGEEMEDSGMTEDSESLTSIPRQFFILRQKKHKYRCKCCHGDLQTAPAPAKITPGGSYSDEMTIDVSLTKYCDLIPIERYAQMAGRSGLMDLPPNSLIQLTHNLARFLKGTYELVKKEVASSKLLKADETTHRMLEGDIKSNWYLWGFSTQTAAYFEAHDTRSGDVASDFLKDSKCEFLLTDAYSGYQKAVRESNMLRLKYELPLIQNVYCNAHARRKFKEAKDKYLDESDFFIKCYEKIYRLEKEEMWKKYPLEKIRKWQSLYFRAMERMVVKLQNSYSTKSSLGKAMSYFYKNYRQLSLFLDYDFIPVDNNSQERLMRSPVIGRKTWYGNHSKRGAETSSIIFSLVESCKLNKVNPREYFKDLVKDLHQGKEAYTPAQYAKIA